MFTPTVYIYIKETCTLIHGNKPATDVYVPYQKIRALHIECLLTQGKPFANMAIKKKKNHLKNMVLRAANVLIVT